MTTAIDTSTIHVDGNRNRITVQRHAGTCQSLPVHIARLADQPALGYLVIDEGTGGFGDEACPSSYGMPCMTWFGPGERYDTVEDALADCVDGFPFATGPARR